MDQQKSVLIHHRRYLYIQADYPDPGNLPAQLQRRLRTYDANPAA